MCMFTYIELVCVIHHHRVIKLVSSISPCIFCYIVETVEVIQRTLHSLALVH